MKTFTIEAGTLARSALAMLADNRLGFQSEANRNRGRCRYLYADDRRCPIVAGLPTEAVLRINEMVGVSTVRLLIRQRILRVTSDVLSPDEVESRLAKIQARHDSLMLRGLERHHIERVAAELYRMLRELADLHPEAISPPPHPDRSADGTQQSPGGAGDGEAAT